MVKIKQNNLSLFLESVVLTRIDLEHIENILKKVSSDITYKIEEYEYKNINELRYISSKKLSKLEICSKNPNIYIDFMHNKIYVCVHSLDLEARGAWGEVIHFLKSKKKNNLKEFYTTVSNICIGFFIAYLQISFVSISIFSLTIFFLIMANSFILVYGPNNSVINLSNNQIGFLEKNKDPMLVALFTVVLTIILSKIFL